MQISRVVPPAGIKSFLVSIIEITIIITLLYIILLI